MSRQTLLLGASASRRPAPVRQPPLPPFDPNPDPGGLVHTSPPPELVIPPGPDLMFLRADFTGVTLNANRWGGLLRFIDTFKVGANSTPYTMIMTPMLPLYPRWLQDATLTEHAERSLSHLVVASDGWNFPENGFAWTPTQFVAWCQYVQSWGFSVVYWGPVVARDRYLQAAVDAHAIDWHILGEEVDTKVTPEQYEVMLDDALAVHGRGIPTGAHFTSDWPEGFPRDTFFDGRSMSGFDKYDGVVHLMWQANQEESAGTQAARLYYARQRVALGLVGGNGQHALKSRVYVYETMATAQLEGKCDEAYGNLRSLELLYATRSDDRIPPLAGFGNGCRLPDGRPV